jgi:putative CocE/NonD family hydrolase
VEKHLTIEFDVPATMRDGTVLRATIYRPQGEGRWPVLLTRTPYDKDIPRADVLLDLDPARTARQGYVVILQDVRGRAASEGEWDIANLALEDLDSEDTVIWAASLSYSNGQVGMYGESYMAFTQWAALSQQPSALKAAAPAKTWHDAADGFSFRGGALELGLMSYWRLTLWFDTFSRQYREHGDEQRFTAQMQRLIADINNLPEGANSLPLRSYVPFATDQRGGTFQEVIRRGLDRDFLEPFSPRTRLARVTVPTLHIAGWYDVFLAGTLDNFTYLRHQGSTEAARQAKLVIGPWTHLDSTSTQGEQNFGLAASSAGQTDLMSYQLRWFDQLLKGRETGILNEAPVKLFVMGSNAWRDEQEWPLARAVETRYYLHSRGHANTLSGDGLLSTTLPAHEEPDHYTYDPHHPVLTRGGAIFIVPDYPGGPLDQRSLEQREDVLVYTTPPLEQDIEVTGPIKVHLWAISSSPDTDFVARLIDVHPDGTAFNLTDGIIRTRYRHFAQSGETTLIEPGKAYVYEIDLWATSNLFKKGHHIRLDITSSNFPRWDRNPNTGHDFGRDAEIVVARQAILHDAAYPSYIVLPIVPEV